MKEIDDFTIEIHHSSCLGVYPSAQKVSFTHTLGFDAHKKHKLAQSLTIYPLAKQTAQQNTSISQYSYMNNVPKSLAAMIKTF